MPRFLVGFFPLTLLHLGRCWSKWFFTTPLLIVPNREAIGKIKREIWDETNRTNVVERTHDLTGWCCRMTIPPTPLRHSLSLHLQVTSNQGCMECHHGGRARDVDDDTERCLHIMKWQEWDSNKHLHFPGQGHWHHLFSRSHGWRSTGLMPDVIFKTAQFEKIMMQLFAVLVLLMLRWLWEKNHCIDPHLLFGSAVVDFRRNMIAEMLCFAFSQEVCKTRINTADLRVQVHQRKQNADVIKSRIDSHLLFGSAVRLIPKATDFRRNLIA